MLRRSLSLKSRLAGGAALLGAGAVLTAFILYIGMARVGERMDAALAAETRMARYSVLSTQVSTYLVIATEAVQAGVAPQIRAERMETVVDTIRQTFGLLHDDLEQALAGMHSLGLDQQSRHATQSIGLARMQALLENTTQALRSDVKDKEHLQAYINSFTSGFDPLLNQAVNTEVIFRNEIFAGIAKLREDLSLLAGAIAGACILALLVFYLGLIRPQFSRLDRLRAAARRIGNEDFNTALPATYNDEIGQLYSETNRMAAALAAQRARIDQDRARLNEIIEQRTLELRAANARLEKTDETRRRFFADISHELRTPLTVILMEAQLGRQCAPEVAPAFATIENRAERLNRRIDDLLRVARSDSGHLALETQPVDLEEISVQVVEEIEAECTSAGIGLEVVRCPAVSIKADPNWLRQVLVGLVRNAIRHAREGAALRLSPQITAQRAGFSVTDNGPGIPLENQSAIFDRFTQGGGAQSEGFGLGLSLARWVIEAQDGVIGLQSPLPRDTAIGGNAGTRLSVLLPRIKE